MFLSFHDDKVAVDKLNAVLAAKRLLRSAFPAGFPAVPDVGIDDYGENEAEVASDRMAAEIQEDEFCLNIG